MKSVETLIEEVFSNPTAPYRENWVLSYIEKELNQMDVPFFRDRWGNIIAGSRSKHELNKKPRVALMAHTDHPGFHIIKRLSARRYQARWFGGNPPTMNRAKLWIYDPRDSACITKARVVSGRFIPPRKIFTLQTDLPTELSLDCFGAFGFAGYKKKGHRVFTRAADDLTGAVIILATLARLPKPLRSSCVGIFTRAEETGFRGALGIVESRLLSSKISVISLEASKTLPGARLGKGPVIRLGDKRSLFDTRLTSRLDAAAGRLSAREKKFSVQRRIMGGGTCEATVFNLTTNRAAGLAVPLGNYHNQRPNDKPGPEYIDVRDVKGAVLLCVEFYKGLAKAKGPIDEFLDEVMDEFRSERQMLLNRIRFKSE